MNCARATRPSNAQQEMLPRPGTFTSLCGPVMTFTLTSRVMLGLRLENSESAIMATSLVRPRFIAIDDLCN